MIILGIETSCDETAVAIVDSNKKILGHRVLSQLDIHKEFGGVVPEIAARAHLDYLPKLITQTLSDAKLSFKDLDAVAATSGPGLIGGVIVGMMAAKAIAASHNLPFYAVNHLEGHALTPRLTDDVEFPYLLLLISGGHTQLLIAEQNGAYHPLGTTLDDACGECFDKAAKSMGLGYPGGPELEKLAHECTNHSAAIERFPLPRPLLNKPGLDFSFSGLKTAVKNHVDALPGETLNRADMADLAYAFETCVAEILGKRCQKALKHFISEFKPANPTLVIAGGVAANKTIRGALDDAANAQNARLVAPPPALCTDNAAMIAWAAIEKSKRSQGDSFDFKARPRWPLDQIA